MVLTPLEAPTFHIDRSSARICTCVLDDCETLGLGCGKSICGSFFPQGFDAPERALVCC